jgi:hypothetical protein
MPPKFAPRIAHRQQTGVAVIWSRPPAQVRVAILSWEYAVAVEVPDGNRI